uniref:Doublecortin domain-containing protein 2 n=1 Tax=Electrophorus electricus TaxID=8005 RepID=A0A4W4EZ18_ELEEL
MHGEKHSFLSQPVVKNIYVFRNGDPHYEARRLVINEKRVSNFETLLREVTGGVKAQFGAVRNIYTPKGGHRVESMEHLQNGEQYVAAGREKFKKLDYLQIGNRKKRMLQNNGMVKPVAQSRITVAARFLKPIKEPCAIFVLANGDVLNPAVRFLVPNRLQGQLERILEMITEKMGLRVMGGVRSLHTFDGVPITDGKELEQGQFYVAVGRNKFKRLPYSDLLFTRPMEASLPPIYGIRRQTGDVSRPQRDIIKAVNSDLLTFSINWYPHLCISTLEAIQYLVDTLQVFCSDRY